MNNERLIEPSTLAVLFAAVLERRNTYSAMCTENPDHESSVEGFAVCGEIDGLYRAIALTPARTRPDWDVKNASLLDLHSTSKGGHSAVNMREEIPAMLAASLLDDIAAILKDDDLALAA